MGVRKCSSLKIGEKVVFKADEFGLKDVVLDGDVNAPGLSAQGDKVSVIYLAGYKCRNTWVPFDKMLGVYNPEGEVINFGGVVGPSDRLVAE